MAIACAREGKEERNGERKKNVNNKRREEDKRTKRREQREQGQEREHEAETVETILDSSRFSALTLAQPSQVNPIS